MPEVLFLAAGAAKQRSDTSQEFFRAEGLYKVIIAARVQASHPVLDHALGSEEENGSVKEKNGKLSFCNFGLGNWEIAFIQLLLQIC